MDAPKPTRGRNAFATTLAIWNLPCVLCGSRVWVHVEKRNSRFNEHGITSGC